MPFKTRLEIEAREFAHQIELDSMKTAVADLDLHPLTPYDKFYGDDMFDGFYAGKVVTESEHYFAIWSRLADRVAILPKRSFAQAPAVGTVIAAHAWGLSKILNRCVALTSDYGWLDAFDDFCIAFQRQYDWRMKASIEGVGCDVFALDARGHVSEWHPDYPAYARKHDLIYR